MRIASAVRMTILGSNRFLPLVGMTRLWGAKLLRDKNLWNEKGGSGRCRFPTPVRRQNLLDPGALGLRTGSRTAVHVVHHALFMAVHQFGGFGPLVGRENREQFRLDPGFRNDEFGHGLSLFRSLGADRGLIKCWALFQSSHLLVPVRHLLHQRLEVRLLLFENRLGLRLLGIG